MESKGRPGLGAAREESALNMFRQMDLKGKAKDDTQLRTVHQNTIPTIRVYEQADQATRKFSSKSRYRSSNLRMGLGLTDFSQRSRRTCGDLVSMIDARKRYVRRCIVKILSIKCSGK